MGTRTRMDRARFVLSTLILAFTLIGLTQGLISCSDDNPTAACDGNCGSGDVYWDESVDRCRDRDNGQVVKSCCCGH